MAVSSGFFNSVNHDRLYNADQISSMFDGIITEGVYLNVGTAFKVTPFSEANDTVIVGTGRAWFMHTWTYNDSEYTITLEPPNNFMDRIDAIVIDVDKTDSVRKNSILCLQGTPSASGAMPPNLTNETNHKQYPIAYITRPAGTSSPVLSSQIQYLVGTTCPVVTGPLEVINSENFFQQMQGEFDEWFNGIKDTMDENVVTNILHQIDELKNQLEEQSQQVGLLTKNAYDIFKKGPVDLDITTYRLLYYNKSAVISDITYPNLYNNGVHSIDLSHDVWIREAGFPVVSFLPNGKIFRLYFLSSSDSSWAGIYYTITNTDGVTEKHAEVPDLIDESVSTGMSNESYFGVTNIHFDSWPAYFDLVTIMSGRSDGMLMARIAISSDEVISTNTKFTQSTYEGGSYIPTATYISNSATSIVPAVFSDGSSLFATSVTFDYSTTGWYCNKFSKVTSDGIVQLCKIIIYGSRTSPVDPMNSEAMVFATSGGHSGNYIYSARWFVFGVTDDDKAIAVDTGGAPAITSSVNPDRSVDLTVINPSKAAFNITSSDGSSTDKQDGSTVDKIPNFHIGVKKVVPGNMYNLSEVNGVTVSSSSSENYLVERNGVSSSSEKVSDYFMGASNKAVDLPEGAYIAFKNDQGTLIGISPSGGVEIVGSNGGAALFKNSTTSLDIGMPTKGDTDINDPLNLASPFVNYIEIDGKVGYLYSHPFFKSMAGNHDTSSDATKEVMGDYRYPSVVPRVIWMKKAGV